MQTIVEQLREGNGGTIYLRNVRFGGKTYDHRVLFKSMGATWDGSFWNLAGYVNKPALALVLDKIEWCYHTPDSSYRNNKVHVSADYDEEYHCRVADHCSCTANITCNNCKYACCGEAIPYSKEELAHEMFSGVIYKCANHGLVFKGTHD
jgi:hypothetical protein